MDNESIEFNLKANNIFCASNPAKLVEALWSILTNGVGSGSARPNAAGGLTPTLQNHDFSNDIIFLPSRRAIRTVEKFIADKSGGAALLPKLVALGEEPEEDDVGADIICPEIVSNQERIIVLAELLSKADRRPLASMLPVARDLVRMQDYIENEIANSKEQRANIDWRGLVDEKYAAHFQKKAEFLTLADSVLPNIFPNKITAAQKRNQDIRDWKNVISHIEPPLGRSATTPPPEGGDVHRARLCHSGEGRNATPRVIICGSTGSVPATADLMEFVSGLPNGAIILPGKIPLLGRGVSCEATDGEGINVCNPYHSELKFLKRINVLPEDVNVIDVGESNIDFFNSAFSNKLDNSSFILHPSSLSRIDCARESEEAECAAEIAARAAAENKTVLIITPDAAGNQRLKEAFARRNISADFSGGTSGAMTFLGRAILNKFDEKVSNQQSAIKNLFEFIDKFNLNICDASSPPLEGCPQGGVVRESENNNECSNHPGASRHPSKGGELIPIIEKLKEVSDILERNGIVPSAEDARALVADALSSVQIRQPMDDGAKVFVLGTIESRMQSADVVILTGLNEGMFPALGYENPWLPRRIADKIGLPPPERKVSLMAMDFINLSCNPQVYWLRSRVSGGMQTTESRFLSRIEVTDKLANSKQQTAILQSVRDRDNVPYRPLSSAPPMPPADRSTVYVTDLELLIHNPYAFYAKHILRLRPKDDYWMEPGAKEFGTLVHSVIEELANSNEQRANIIEKLDKKAKEILPAGSAVFYFWHKRFVEMAPAIEKMLADTKGGESEIKLETIISGRTVRAIADRVWNDVVIDIKTGAAPNKSQLEQGNMPQLPLEAAMRGAKIMQFLQLQNNNVRLIEYAGEQSQKIISASVQKVSELFGRYGNDAEPYEYYETSDAKYKAYDDLARFSL